MRCVIPGQIFKECAPHPSCDLTCRYPDPRQCPKSKACYRRCVCPHDLVLDRKNKKCVKPEYCPEGITVSGIVALQFIFFNKFHIYVSSQ